VSFTPAKKLSLQESNQLIGIKMATLGFSRNIWILIPISRRGANARFAPPSDAHAIIDYFISGFTIKASSSNERQKRF